MYKFVLAISLANLLSGCATKVQYYYTHKDYGIGNSENANFVKDWNECKNSVYANGVISEGKKITNLEEIDSLEKEYNRWIIESITTGVMSNSGSYANAGASAAVAVTTGNTSGLSNKPVESQFEPTPDKYRDLDRLMSELEPCINGKGWINK